MLDWKRYFDHGMSRKCSNMNILSIKAVSFQVKENVNVDVSTWMHDTSLYSPNQS